MHQPVSVTESMQMENETTQLENAIMHKLHKNMREEMESAYV